MRVSCGKMRLAPFGLNFAALPWGSDQRVQARLSFPIRPDFPEADLTGQSLPDPMRQRGESLKTTQDDSTQ